MARVLMVCLIWLFFVITMATCGHLKVAASKNKYIPGTLVAADYSSNSKLPPKHKHYSRRKLVSGGIPGFISIDCGLPEDSRGYTDEKTEIVYSPDAEFTETGVNFNISSDFPYTIWDNLQTVRSFPNGSRNCYTLRPEQGKANTYLIRATFMYGNYDGTNQAPQFDLYLGVNKWDTLGFSNATSLVTKEIIHVPSTDYIEVCLVNTNNGIPFISALELRLLNNVTYKTTTGSLVVWGRNDYGGSMTDGARPVRYKDDEYDRFWYSASTPALRTISTPLTVESLSDNDYKPPPMVMRTAITPTLSNHSMELTWTPPNSTSEYYVYMHFAEISVGDTLREFNIYLDGTIWGKPLTPRRLSATTRSSITSLRGLEINFEFRPTDRSILPPLINAVEIYEVKNLLQSPTEQEDVDAIMNIKKFYAVKKNWRGDPCLPEVYSWDGLTCRYNGIHCPKIIALSLTSSGLNGEISPSLSNLSSLQYLDLSYNSLTGTIPEFIVEMSSLKTLNLTGNKLTGSVPQVLIEKANNKSLTLRVCENSDNFESVLCGNAGKQRKKYKPKKFIIPVATSIGIISLVLLISVAVFYIIRNKRHKDIVVSQGGAVKSKGQKFTYSQIVSMTNNFQVVIGRGGSGTVFQGVLGDGTEVAVKIFSPSTTQTNAFHTEAQLLIRIHHRNLVSIIGYCDQGKTMALVCEYLANGNLQQHLSERSTNILSWKERLEIAVDAAHGLEYLHNGCKPPIIHRDMKTANILLNGKLQAKIADFGLSKIIASETETHVSTETVAGTKGYLDPEYYTTFRLSEKSDVYSFGIVLLELITGQPAIRRDTKISYIVKWVNSMVVKGDIYQIVDPSVEEDFNVNSAWKILETAMGCLPHTAIKRPNMSHVLSELKECLAIQTAHERSGRMESNNAATQRSFEQDFVDPVTEMAPHAR